MEVKEEGARMNATDAKNNKKEKSILEKEPLKYISFFNRD